MSLTTINPCFKTSNEKTQLSNAKEERKIQGNVENFMNKNFSAATGEAQRMEHSLEYT